MQSDRSTLSIWGREGSVVVFVEVREFVSSKRLLTQPCGCIDPSGDLNVAVPLKLRDYYSV